MAVTTLAGHRRRHAPDVVIGDVADGLGSAAVFYYPEILHTDVRGEVIVIDGQGQFIRKISTQGMVTTILNTATSGIRSLNANCAVSNSVGEVLFSCVKTCAIYKLAEGGTISTLAGDGIRRGLSSIPADGQGAAASFVHPGAMTLDGDENLVIADGTRLRRVSPQGIVTTLVDFQDTCGLSNDIAPNWINAVVVAPNGSIFVADQVNGCIRELSCAGIVTTLAGTVARFQFLNGMTLDGDGNLIVADMLNNSVCKVTLNGVVTTLAGSGEGSPFYLPGAVDMSPTGDIIVANTGFHCIQLIAAHLRPPVHPTKWKFLMTRMLFRMGRLVAAGRAGMRVKITATLMHDGSLAFAQPALSDLQTLSMHLCQLPGNLIHKIVSMS